MTEKTIDLTGRATLGFVERGDGSGPVVILLHGFADSWRSFERLLPYLPASFHVLALTQRGHGDASRPPAGYGLPDFSSDLLAFFDALSIDRAVIVGHSMGSGVALRFAIDHPRRVDGLVLIGAAASARGTAEARAHWDGVLAKLSDPIPRDFVRAATEQDFVKPIPPEMLETLTDESAKVPLRVWRAILEARWRGEGDHSTELMTIQKPALILWGERDARYKRSEQDALLRAIRGSRLVTFEGAGHMLHIEEPERCAREITTFVVGAAH